MAAEIGRNITTLRNSLPEGVNLVAVSKFQPVEPIQAAYDAGQRCFGESRTAELLIKRRQLPDDIRWHFIGHLQTNKVKDIIGRTALIESIDSNRLLDLVDRLSVEKGVVSRVLMQVHVAAEDTKFGWRPDDLLEYFRRREFEKLRATHLCGLMGMATNTDDIERITEDFRAIASLHRAILDIAPDLRGFDILSMGMSDDYRLAIQHGANNVRIGSAIFGERS